MEAVSAHGIRDDAATEPANPPNHSSPTRWIRAGAISGILAFVAVLATKPIGGASLINANSTAAQIARNLGAHPDRTLASNALTIIALALALWFGVTLAHLVGERDKTSPLGTVILTGSICIFVTGAFDAITQSALVFLAKEDSLTAEPQLTRLVYVLYDGPIQPGIMGLAIAIFLIAVGAAALRRDDRGTLGRLAQPRLRAHLRRRRDPRPHRHQRRQPRARRARSPRRPPDHRHRQRLPSPPTGQPEQGTTPERRTVGDQLLAAVRRPWGIGRVIRSRSCRRCAGSGARIGSGRPR